eukprot:TRINITY_DN24562_c0_g1_i1.p2 TRINITY_DN24562_c0_g1~~TRINITY_DN24562_c0_g1_i1.p2  ORF type:complete len:111 (-),score=20.86 TRINITY_DN24562_c0_g1_i1:90-422(-)
MRRNNSVFCCISARILGSSLGAEDYFPVTELDELTRSKIVGGTPVPTVDGTDIVHDRSFVPMNHVVDYKLLKLVAYYITVTNNEGTLIEHHVMCSSAVLFATPIDVGVTK